MTFDEILDQAIEMLQRRGRLTYRTLKRQFNLDDEALDDLKEELIEGQRVATDENGRVLVWTGETEPEPEPASPVPAQPEATRQDQPTQVQTPPTEAPTPDQAERRQLTVMFCDLSDSTRLSSQLDPEDLRDVIRAYQETAAGVIQRYEGHIAQYLGDGLLVYFGWPQAHEDDAQRGVHAGLGIVEAMDTLNTQLEQDKSVRLAVRIGIHTGPVVIGEMGGGGRHEQLALGETTNIAARLEGMAQPNTVVISDTTYRLVEGYFVCDNLGLYDLKGIATPIQTYRVRETTGVQGRLEVAATRGLTPLVGRESEVALLLERWEQVKEGQGQVVLFSGEAGIGKSRLLQVLRDHIAGEPHTRLECRSSPYYQNTALYPITDMLQRLLNWHQDNTPQAKLEKLEQTLGQYRLTLEETVPLFAKLLSLPLSEDLYPALEWAPQRQRQQTLASIVSMLLQQTGQRPVLLIVEDLHWTDPSTLELLDLLIDQIPTATICMLLTCRPTFEVPWGSRSYLTQMTLNRLSRPQVEQVAERVAGGKHLPGEVLQQIVEKTDGVPLFVEELTKTVVESGALKEVNGQYELAGSLSSLSIPATLQDSLMARLDRLVTAKAVAQYASVIGRQFSYELLQAVSQLSDAVLQPELARLIEAELIYQRGLPPLAAYTFKHALVADAAYHSLLKGTRQQYHQQVARVLEAQFPETAETQPELLAHHFTEAGLIETAICYWQRAGQRALQGSAYTEAIARLTQGLALLMTLTETPQRLQQELDLQVTLGSALLPTKGNAAPEVERTLVRAQELCQQIGDTSQLLPVLRGLSVHYLGRGQLHKAIELGEQMLRLAETESEPAHLMLAHNQLGHVLFYQGEPALAQTHLTQALDVYNPQQPQPQVAYQDAIRHGVTIPLFSSHGFLALVLWQLGYPDQAMRHSQTVRTLAQESSHSHTQTHVWLFAAVFHQFRREVTLAYELARSAIALATEHGFAERLARGTVLYGWALAMQGQIEEGLAEIRQGLAADRASGARVWQPYCTGLLAEAYGEGGRPDEGLPLLNDALAMMEMTAARLYRVELYRLKGALLLRQAVPDTFQAETCFHQALTVAREQQAKSWELRVATSLARLWQSQGKRQEAYDLLAPVHGWFTEGFDTADLKDAKALLDELV